MSKWEQCNTQTDIFYNELFVKELKEDPGTIDIVIFNFVQSDNIPDTKIERELATSINEVARELAQLKIRATSSKIEVPLNSRCRALRFGRKKNADFVVWGEDTGLRVSARIAYLHNSNEQTLHCSEPENSMLVNPAGYTDYILDGLPRTLGASTCYILGTIAQHEGRHMEASSLLQEALDLIQDNASTEIDTCSIALAASYSNYFSGKWEYAADNATKAMACEDQYEEALMMRGRSQHLAGDYQRAKQDFDVYIESHDVEYAGYLRRALSSAQQGNYETAILDIETAITMNPEQLISYNILAETASDAGYRERAAETCLRALDIEPEDPYCNRLLARNYRNAGNNDLASSRPEMDKRL
jgi:tetratricopeptide (TPR) repeat protein